ncbi:TraS protein [Escherichia coli]|nr:TraS protein [Escherichia coli]
MSAWSPEHITLRRTENGNVIAHDSRDDQEFIFAECCSDEIANIILEAVKRYTSTEPAHGKRQRSTVLTLIYW